MTKNGTVTETTHLLPPSFARLRDGDNDNGSVRSQAESIMSKEEVGMGVTAVGERLPYNDYATIDWMHDLVKDSIRRRNIRNQPYSNSHSHSWPSLRVLYDSGEGWLVVALIGIFTAIVAFIVDIAQSSVFDWKEGYCSTSPFLNRENCCRGRGGESGCDEWKWWTSSVGTGYPLYVAIAVAYGLFSVGITMTTKRKLPTPDGEGKMMYMASGSGIPEIKTILSGFVIKGFLGIKVLVVKAIGAVFAVGSGLCLGKEGPFVHISACVGNIVGGWFPKYRDNGRKRREIISSACAAGLSVAFGAPIGGVLFSFEEISTYFPRKVLWRSFFCSLVAAITLKMLNPLQTGKLVLFETSYSTSYEPIHYVVFVLLGVCGGIFGAVFCQANYTYSRKFRKYAIVKNNPVVEVFFVVLLTGIIQYPNRLTREGGDTLIKVMLVDCVDGNKDWVCQQEDANSGRHGAYSMYLVLGMLAKLFLTTITFGCKVPSGIIIPALDAGALFGRLVGFGLSTLTTTAVSPGIFAMVGAAAFLAGVTRMTLSLCVIMFELTGQLEYVIPHMVAILVSKWTADALEPEGVYDLAQSVLGHPFLDPETATVLAGSTGSTLSCLIPPKQTMDEITVLVDKSGCVKRNVLEEKLEMLKRRGLSDAGVVLVTNEGYLLGYLAEGELEFGLNQSKMVLSAGSNVGQVVQLIVRYGDEGADEQGPDSDKVDLSMFVDRTPMMLVESAPLEYAVEMFGKLGLRYLCVVKEQSEGGQLLGVVIKKRVVAYLDGLKEE